MKNLFLPLILICCLTAMSSSCNNKTKQMGDEIKEEQKSDITTETQDSEMTTQNMKEDCHGVRKTIRKVKDKEGEILMIGNNVTISIPPGTERYKVCEVSEEIKKDGIKVKFSGEILETFPNERLMGTPARLTEITKID